MDGESVGGKILERMFEAIALLLTRGVLRLYMKLLRLQALVACLRRFLLVAYPSLPARQSTGCQNRCLDIETPDTSHIPRDEDRSTMVNVTRSASDARWRSEDRSGDGTFRSAALRGT
jgi:hypothetical protein